MSALRAPIAFSATLPRWCQAGLRASWKRSPNRLCDIACLLLLLPLSLDFLDLAHLVLLAVTDEQMLLRVVHPPPTVGAGQCLRCLFTHQRAFLSGQGGVLQRHSLQRKSTRRRFPRPSVNCVVKRLLPQSSHLDT